MSCSVWASTMISPARAAPQSRAARFGTLPIAAYSQRCSKPMTPSVASPCAMPMPRPTSWPSFAQASEIGVKALCSSSAMRTARSAGHDRFGHRAREEALHAPEALELRHLVADALLELLVELLQLVLQRLDAKQR